MRVVFFGTSPFAVPTLEALHAAAPRHEVLAIVTQPDRPGGRGMQLQESPVKRRALALGYPILQPEKVRRAPFPAELAALAPDILVVVSFGQIIPQKVLDIPPFGGVNVHASLLPRWRGAAPIHRAIEAGDAETGVATMHMEATLDTGPVYLEHREPIGDEDTTLALEPRLADAGARLLIATLDALERGGLTATTQAGEGATYASMVEREDGFLDPTTHSARALRNKVRAFSPRPGGVLIVAGRELKVIECAVEAGDGAPGTVVAAGRDGIRIATIDGILRLIKVQAPGKPVIDAAAWANGARLQPGAPSASPASVSTA